MLRDGERTGDDRRRMTALLIANASPSDGFGVENVRGLGLRDGLKAAAKADFISLTFFEVGLFGWMALMAFVFFPAPHHLMPNSAGYWFLMQIGMMIGFLTSWPANVWLVNRGIKVPM